MRGGEVNHYLGASRYMAVGISYQQMPKLSGITLYKESFNINMRRDMGIGG